MLAIVYTDAYTRDGAGLRQKQAASGHIGRRRGAAQQVHTTGALKIFRRLRSAGINQPRRNATHPYARRQRLGL